MSKKLEKLRASQAKDKERLELLQARLKAREEDIRVEEKTEILGIVEEIGMTPEQLAEHFADLLAQKRQSKKKEDSANETV
mgnify:CR=1 FL=1